MWQRSSLGHTGSVALESTAQAQTVTGVVVERCPRCFASQGFSRVRLKDVVVSQVRDGSHVHFKLPSFCLRLAASASSSFSLFSDMRLPGGSGTARPLGEGAVAIVSCLCKMFM